MDALRFSEPQLLDHLRIEMISEQNFEGKEIGSHRSFVSGARFEAETPETRRPDELRELPVSIREYDLIALQACEGGEQVVVSRASNAADIRVLFDGDPSLARVFLAKVAHSFPHLRTSVKDLLDVAPARLR